MSHLNWKRHYQICIQRLSSFKESERRGKEMSFWSDAWFISLYLPTILDSLGKKVYELYLILFQGMALSLYFLLFMKFKASQKVEWLVQSFMNF